MHWVSLKASLLPGLILGRLQVAISSCVVADSALRFFSLKGLWLFLTPSCLFLPSVALCAPPPLPPVFCKMAMHPIDT